VRGRRVDIHFKVVGGGLKRFLFKASATGDTKRSNNSSTLFTHFADENACAALDLFHLRRLSF